MGGSGVWRSCKELPYWLKADFYRNGRVMVSEAFVCSEGSAVADPGDPRVKGANSPGNAKISQKLHRIERIWTHGGGGGGVTRPLRPLRSATGVGTTLLLTCSSDH